MLHTTLGSTKILCLELVPNSSVNCYRWHQEGCMQKINIETCLKNIIIIIIKKGRQCKAEKGWYTPYQSEDPSPTIPTNRQKEKGKIVEA